MFSDEMRSDKLAFEVDKMINFCQEINKKIVFAISVKNNPTDRCGHNTKKWHPGPTVMYNS